MAEKLPLELHAEYCRRLEEHGLELARMKGRIDARITENTEHLKLAWEKYAIMSRNANGDKDVQRNR